LDKPEIRSCLIAELWVNTLTLATAMMSACQNTTAIEVGGYLTKIRGDRWRKVWKKENDSFLHPSF